MSGDLIGRDELRARGCALGDREACRALKNADYESVELRAHYLRAACAGFAPYCGALADLYRAGLGVPKDAEMADQLDRIRRAAFRRKLNRHPELYSLWRSLREFRAIARR